MNTIKSISERILRILNGGNTKRDSQFHELDIQYFVRDTSASLIKGEWFAERNEGGKDIDSRYVVPFSGIEVKKNEYGDNYIDIPVDSYIRLPDGAGIRSVRPDSVGTKTKRSKNVETRAFIPIPNRFEDIYFQLPVASLEGIFGWMVRKDKIYFTKRYNQTLLQYGVSKVTVDIVTSDPKAIAVDEALPLSGEMVQQLMLEVVAFFRDGKPQVVDVINDENPNIIKAE